MPCLLLSDGEADLVLAARTGRRHGRLQRHHHSASNPSPGSLLRMQFIVLARSCSEVAILPPVCFLSHLPFINIVLLLQEDTNLEFMNHLEYLRTAKSLYKVSDEDKEDGSNI